MKMRTLIAGLAGLAPALLFLPVPAAAAPPPWAHARAYPRAHAPWLSANRLANGAARGAPGAAGGYPWPQQKITANDWTAGDLYGYSAALTPNTAFVAAPLATIGGNVHEGAIYVYRKSHGTWTQVQKITPDDGSAYDEFGISISVSGNRLLVGAANHGGTGAAYVFKRTGGSWTQIQEFTASDGFGFGYVVTLSGNTAVIGAPGVNDFAGAAYVFTRLNGVWTQTAELTASDGAAGDQLGNAVGIAGSTVVVGAWHASVGGNADEGAVYVFANSGGIWSQTQKLAASDGGVAYEFGESLALSGSTALIGSIGAGPGINEAVYVFTKTGGSWTQTQELTEAVGLQQFGGWVSLHGTTAVIAAPYATVGGNSLAGRAYVFTKSDGTWNQEKVLTASDASPGEFFGFAVGASANGVIATALPDFAGGAGPDAAYIFGPINLGVTKGTP